ncbi:SRPBCC family protein [Segetibacter aerophilus]|uniref:Activator of Hsp90 ATPase homologue 1/2-like C-terminal domain-containing protein n=1 Tax=Segetibacter aerophilus TaxID=670293 RepID=A0A512B6V1_9BACT|nr:SRPBCC domain-containing protein [Segetibacter aerophilus]GEO07682.1 hypothetical protein SAE01_01780 [Segetibacter aerophilus]
MADDPVVIEYTYNASIDKVWTAITDKDQMKHWYFELEEFKPIVGFEFSFKGGKDERTYLHLCKVVEVVEGSKLVYSWQYEGYVGRSLVTFKLSPEDTRTRLTLTHEGLETFPADNRDLAKENFAAGWAYILGTSLANFLAKT